MDKKLFSFRERSHLILCLGNKIEDGNYLWLRVSDSVSHTNRPRQEGGGLSTLPSTGRTLLPPAAGAQGSPSRCDFQRHPLLWPTFQITSQTAGYSTLQASSKSPCPSEPSRTKEHQFNHLENTPTLNHK